MLPTIEPPAWTNQELIVYHGTSARAAEQILAPGGITVAGGRAATDFGPGFYTTSVLRQAFTWGLRIARRSGQREEPAIVEIAIDRAELAALHGLWFVLGHFDATDFWSFVFHCREEAGGHALRSSAYYDVVGGPVSASWAQRLSLHEADQISFHTPRAERLLNRSARRLFK